MKFLNINPGGQEITVVPAGNPTVVDIRDAFTAQSGLIPDTLAMVVIIPLKGEVMIQGVFPGSPANFSYSVRAGDAPFKAGWTADPLPVPSAPALCRISLINTTEPPAGSSSSAPPEDAEVAVCLMGYAEA